jgi:acetyl esterase/lipase
MSVSPCSRTPSSLVSSPFKSSLRPAKLRCGPLARSADATVVWDSVELSYGSDPLQKLDFWKSDSPNVPLVIFVHGGGWKRG